jgi:hypothetical protein
MASEADLDLEADMVQNDRLPKLESIQHLGLVREEICIGNRRCNGGLRRMFEGFRWASSLRNDD